MSKEVGEMLQEFFPEMQTFKSANANKVPQHLVVQDLHIEAEQEFETLMQVLNQNEQTIIFCDRRSKVDKVCEFLKTKDIFNLPFYEDSKMTAQ